MIAREIAQVSEIYKIGRRLCKSPPVFKTSAARITELLSAVSDALVSSAFFLFYCFSRAIPQTQDRLFLLPFLARDDFPDQLLILHHGVKRMVQYIDPDARVKAFVGLGWRPEDKAPFVSGTSFISNLF